MHKTATPVVQPEEEQLDDGYSDSDDDMDIDGRAEQAIPAQNATPVAPPAAQTNDSNPEPEGDTAAKSFGELKASQIKRRFGRACEPLSS